MSRPDVYYGEVAESYDAAREVKAKWKAEQAAFERFLTEGPVLDVPFGTGRFVPIYHRKGIEFTGVDISSEMLAIANRKFPGVNAAVGSAFDLKFKDGEFSTVVCVRFLEWMPVERAKGLLDRLRKIARTLVVTITHGEEGRPEAFTYDFGKFLNAIDGLIIEDRSVTAHVRDMISEMFKLRPAQWSDVVAQFAHDHAADPEKNIQRLADKFAAFFLLPAIPIREDTVGVRAEYWSGEKLTAAVVALADHRFSVGTPPRRDDLPLTVIERDGLSLIVDGRKRANLWMKDKGPHPVLVIRPQ